MNSFFRQPMEDKMKISQEYSKYFNGYKWPRSTNISPGESIDVKESVDSTTSHINRSYANVN
jgi:isopenicillin N synthase-like dioxygenase